MFKVNSGSNRLVLVSLLLTLSISDTFPVLLLLLLLLLFCCLFVCLFFFPSVSRCKCWVEYFITKLKFIFKDKLSVATVNNGFQLFPFFGHIELHLRCCIGLELNIATSRKILKGNIECKLKNLTILDALKCISRDILH